MAITLPLPVRVAAGLVATGIQVVRSLPEEIPAIPVALVGNAMKLSMKVQQEITTLATRGDELLGGIIGGKPQESPSWATFDEDKPAPAPPRGRPAAPRPASPAATPARSTDAASTDTGRPNRAAAQPEGTAADRPPAPAPDVAGPPPPEAIRVEDAQSELHTPEATAMSETETTATEAAAEVSDAVIEAATHAGPGPAGTVAEDTVAQDTVAPREAGSETDPAAGTPAETTAAGEPQAPTEPGAATEPDAPSEPDAATEPDAEGPAPLPGYDGMTLAQVRGHLRDLTAEDVSTLLAYEQSGDNRAPFLTLLSNRLVTLGAAES